MAAVRPKQARGKVRLSERTRALANSTNLPPPAAVSSPSKPAQHKAPYTASPACSSAPGAAVAAPSNAVYQSPPLRAARRLTMHDSPCQSAFKESPVAVRRLEFDPESGKAPEGAGSQGCVWDSVERGESTGVLGKPLRPVSGRWKRCVVQVEQGGFFLIEEATETVLLSARRVGDDFFISQSPSFVVDYTDDELVAASMVAPSAAAKPSSGKKGGAEAGSGSHSTRPARVASYPFNGILRCGASRKQYVLYSTACELCDGTLGKFSCGIHTKGTPERQRLGVIRHKLGKLAPGVTARILISDLPPVNPDNQRVVWCPRAQASQESVAVQVPFGSPSGVSSRPDIPTSPPFLSVYNGDHERPGRPCRLISKKPRWNPETRTLALAFDCRRVLQPSGKNFVQTARKSGRMVLQMGKIDEGVYALDFRFPYAPLQAFATLLTTFNWMAP